MSDRTPTARRLLLTIFALIVGLIGLNGAVSAQDVELIGGHEVSAQQVIVRFKDAAPFLARYQSLVSVGVDDSQGIGGTGAVLVHSATATVPQLIQALSARPDVLYVQPNFIYHASDIPNDTQFGNLWGMRNTGQTINGHVGSAGADISAVSAWDVTKGSRSNVVAVIDTGVDYNHPDLVGNLWSAPSAYSLTIGGVNVSFRAGSHGYNAILNSDDPMDDNHHGTHVSGTIGAVGNNGVGVVGVNQVASIMACKFLNASGSGSTAAAVNCIEYAIQVKALFGSQANVRVLSNSWGGSGFDQTLLDEIKKANTNEMLFVVAAGNAGTNNDTTPQYPASFSSPNIIAVAATDNRDGLASFSCYGPTSVHLGAPGVDVLSSVPNNQYGYLSGTSMATPHVAGAAALILSVANLTTAALKSAILNNVDPITSLHNLTVTGGRLNVDRAVRSVLPPTPDFNLSGTPTTQTVVQGASTTYTVSVAALSGFTGAVSFSGTGLPTGATASFSPTSVTGGSGSTTLTVTAGAATPAGSYPLTVTGTSGSLSHSITLTLGVTAAPAPDFSLAVAPSSQTVTQGAGTSYTVTVSPSAGFSAAVSFSVAGLPAGAAASFSPATVSGSGTTTMSVTTGSATPAGTYPLTITGTSGALTHTASASLTVTAAPPAGISLVSITIDKSRVEGYTWPTATVTLSGAPANGIPIHLTSSDPSLAQVGDYDQWSVSAGRQIPTYPVSQPTPITITASYNGVSVSAVFTIVPRGGLTPDFSLSGSPTSQSVVQGSSTSYTVSVAASGGFSGDVVLSGTGLPSGASASFSPSTVTGSGSSTLTVTAGANTPTGTYTLTATGTSGSLTHSIPLTLTVTAFIPPDFSLSANPTSQTVVQGSGADYTISVASAGGFNGAVSFSVSGLPAGASAAFAPATVTGSGSTTLTLTAGAATPVGTYPITITATSGAITHTLSVTLIVTAPGGGISLVSVSIDMTQVRGYQWPTATVKLSGTPSTGLRIHMTTSDPAHASIGDFDAWSISSDRQIPTYPVTTPTVITITASYNGVTKSVQFTIVP